MTMPKGHKVYKDKSYCTICHKYRPKAFKCPVCHRRMRQKPHDHRYRERLA